MKIKKLKMVMERSTTNSEKEDEKKTFTGIN